MREHLDVRHSGDGIVIRNRLPLAQRLGQSLSAAGAGTAILLLASLMPPSAWRSPATTIGIMLVAVAATTLVVFGSATERLVVRPDSVMIIRTFGTLVLSRGEHDRPAYSPVPLAGSATQRASRERGSGVLLFGTPERGVRFGTGLSAAAAAQVLEVFDEIPAGDGATVVASVRSLRMIVSAAWVVGGIAQLLCLDALISAGGDLRLVTLAGWVLVLGVLSMVLLLTLRSLPERVSLA